MQVLQRPQKRDLTSLRLQRAGILRQSAELSQASTSEIEEGLLKKLEEAQKEPNAAESDSDATETTLEMQTGKNMERRRKTSYLDHKEADSMPERNSDDEHEEKSHGRRGAHRDSESGQKASDKWKGSLHEDESREMTAQSILRRQKGRDNANTDDGFPFSIGPNPALCACDRGRNHTKRGGLW